LPPAPHWRGRPCEQENPVHDTEPHQHTAVSPHEHSPESADNLLLDIGADTGALIIHAAAARDQAEIEISPAGRGQARTHNVVRLRQTPGRPVYAAVFPALPAGDYDVWQDTVTKAGTAAVHGGQVASFRLD
jgi:hypothetical protein